MNSPPNPAAPAPAPAADGPRAAEQDVGLQPRERRKTFLAWTRSLHLYVGLFLSPFLIVYAVSTILVNHGWRPTARDIRTTAAVNIPAGINDAERARTILDQLRLSGDVIGQGAVRNQRVVLRVARPGLVKIVTVNMATQQAEIVHRDTGILGAIRWLHFNPGLHKLPNWSFAKLWGWTADTTVYGTLFLTVSGFLLWVGMKSERRMGSFFIAAGAASFVLLLAAFLWP